jgi:hypothetical protein
MTEGVTGLPLPPFHSLRDTTGLVSKKVVKIEFATTTLPSGSSRAWVSGISEAGTKTVSVCEMADYSAGADAADCESVCFLLV